jgi:hypothetical protein
MSSSLLSNEYLRHLITREMTESVNKFSNKKKGYFIIVVIIIL